MTEVFYEDQRVTVLHGDCVDALKGLADASVDAVVTDPPYGLDFMGQDWDAPWRGTGGKATPGRAYQDWCSVWVEQCFRVLKPGGHMLAFGGTRMYHRMAVAIEDAGFEIRDAIAWLYGTGFPKGLDVSKAVDKRLGVERPVLGHRERGFTPGGNEVYGQFSGDTTVTGPGSPEAAEFEGWSTALKPSFEPIVVARKPLEGTVAENVLAYRTGAINIGGCRVGDEQRFLLPFDHDKPLEERTTWFNASPDAESYEGKWVAGRWPPNAVLDEDQAAELDRQSGLQSAKPERMGRRGGQQGGWQGQSTFGTPGMTTHWPAAPAGGASRFFYIAKPDAGERIRLDGTFHPTVKPLSLMRWLVRLVTPPGGLVCEPFAGSGTTVEACLLEGVRCVASEITAEYLPLIRQRIDRQRNPVAAVKATGDDLGLFAFLEEEE